MKENYQAWFINYQDFYQQKSLFDQLKFLIRFAILAPSAHNAQPWKFIIKENTILLLPESTRALSKSDPFDRQLFISLGCALENLLIAADYYHFDTEVKYVPPDRENIAVKIDFKKRNTHDISESHLIFSIPKRHTNRNKYEERLPEKQFIDWMKSLSNADVRVDLVEDKINREKVADMSVNALIETMDDIHFRNELSQYMKSNFTRSKLGMPGFSHGIPAPVSLFASKLVRRVNMKRLEQKKDEALLKKHTPLFCVLSTKKDDRENWIKVGQLYERITLEAEKNNLKTAPLAAALLKEESLSAIKNLLNPDFRPQVLFRIGYCKTSSRQTPRLLQTDVIKSF
jgi:hypothetical protein